MNKPQKHINRCNLILMTIVLCQFAIHSAQAKEPVYDGRPLSDWLLGRPDEEQQNAIRQIGTNAIPILLDILGATDKTVKKVVAKLDNKALRQAVRSGDYDIENLKVLAVNGFGLLGTNAESAVPQMVKLLNNDETSFHAAQSLAEVGPKGFAALTNSLTSQNANVRNSVVFALGQKGGGDPKLVTQLLINALKDEDGGVRANATDFLAGREPDMAIQALIPMLDDKDPDPRRWAAISLGSYGAAAKSAAPKILSLYTNITDPIIFEALKKIDPDTAGKAEEFIVNSGPLNSARIGYTKTLLKNGEELVAGGYISTAIFTLPSRFLSSAELVDPVTGKWTETGEMNVARDGHTATLLTNGKVLVAGGYGRSGELLNAELYDPATGKWSMTGSLNKPRSAAHAVLQSNGKVLVFLEPYRSPICNVEQYDPATEKWTVITNLTRKPK
jgi:HEAT repeat protein